MTIESLIPNLAGLMGVDPTTALALVGFIVSAANLTGRLIPDDKTGVLGTIRKAAKIIGVYAPNRVESRVVEHMVVEQIEEFPQVVKAFPGLDSVEAIIKQTESRLRDSEDN